MLAGGVEALYDVATRSVRCIACPEGGQAANVRIETGIAGASAEREYDRRVARRDVRTKDRFGRRLGGVILALTDEPASTRAWSPSSQFRPSYALGHESCRLSPRRRGPQSIVLAATVKGAAPHAVVVGLFADAVVSICVRPESQRRLPFRASWCHQGFDSGVTLDWVFYPFCFLDLSNEALHVRFERRARELGGLFRPSRRGCSGNGRREPCHAGLMSLISTAPGADAADDGPAVGAAGSARHWACMTTMATVVTRAVHRVLRLPPDPPQPWGHESREQGPVVTLSVPIHGP
jgi:hypothetical protein